MSNEYYTQSDHSEECSGLFDYESCISSPEKKLMVAVLERAVLDYVGNEPRETEQATTWIFEDLYEEEPTSFSFPWICHQLDLDKHNIARKIKQLPKRGSQRVAP